MKTMEGNNQKTVLITGASNGFGMEFAKLFAKDNYNLVLVARSADRLKELGYSLQDEYQLQHVCIVQSDLSRPESPQEIYDELRQKGIQVDVLVNNAGAGLHGFFHETELDRELEIIQLNISSVVHLTVTALCPGASDTMFFKVADAEKTRAANGPLSSPEEVARDGYEALMKGESRIVSGMMNKVQAGASNLLPDSALASTMRFQMEEKEDVDRKMPESKL